MVLMCGVGPIIGFGMRRGRNDRCCVFAKGVIEMGLIEAGGKYPGNIDSSAVSFEHRWHI